MSYPTLINSNSTSIYEKSLTFKQFQKQNTTSIYATGLGVNNHSQKTSLETTLNKLKFSA